MSDPLPLAAFTDGITELVCPLEEELELGASMMWCTQDGQDDWHTIVKIEPVARGDVTCRVHLEHGRRFP